MRQKGKTSAIPNSCIISNETLFKMIAAASSEQESFNKFLDKLMEKIGIENEDRSKLIGKINMNYKDMELLYKFIMSVVYDVVSNEGSLRLFKTDECNAILKGKIMEEKFYDNSILHDVEKEKKYTYIAPFLKIICKSNAPQGKKEYRKNMK